MTKKKKPIGVITTSFKIYELYEPIVITGNHGIIDDNNIGQFLPASTIVRENRK